MTEEFRLLFDTGVERHGTNCVKWDGLGKLFGNPDAIALWVADSDFPTPVEVREALAARALHGALGYSNGGGADKRAAVRWLKERHGLADACEDWLFFSPGVVDALYIAMLALTEEGDKIAIQTPVYGPFHMIVEKGSRLLWENNLIQDAQGAWHMDLADLEEGFKQGVKMLILCSPHNPVGRVWTREELTAVVELCNRYNVQLLCDEIHHDIVMPGYKHTPILAIPGAERAVMTMAPSKTFNLAGLQYSFFVTRDPDLRAKIKAQISKTGIESGNVMGEIATEAAYTYGAAWLDAQNEYLAENRDFTIAYAREHFPDVRITPNEGTYLLFLDFTAWKLPEDDLRALLARCGAAMTEGSFFSKNYATWMRLNLATTRANLEKGLANIAKAYNEAHA